MSVDNLEERLAAQQEDYAAARPPVDGDDVADGTYQALVRGFDFFESNAGVAYIKIQLEIALDTEYEGAVVEVMHGLEPRGDQDPEQWRKALGRLKADLKTLGVDGDTPLTEIRPGSATLDAVLDVPVEIAIKTSERINPKTDKPYRNVYINERLGDPMSRPPASDVPVDDTPDFAPPVDGADEDIPF